MARKHPNPIKNPPAASSEDEEDVVEEEEEEESVPSANNDGSETEEEPLEVAGEEEEESEEEEEEESEEEEDDDDKSKLEKEKIHPQPSKSTLDALEEEDEDEEDDDDDDKAKLEKEKIHQKPSEDEEEEEDEEEDETESDSDPKSSGASGFTIKEHSKSKPPLSPVLVSNKRLAETHTSRSTSKKAKTENGGGEGKGKKVGSSRFWSDTDEIVILKGLIDFQDRKVDPTSHSADFFEFIKDTLSVEPSKMQLMEKVRRLKKKYFNSVAKARNGEDPVFSRPNEHKSFQLSKQIWGGESATPKKNPSSTKKNKIPATDNANPTPVNGIATIRKSLLQEESAPPLCNNNDLAGDFSQLYPFLNLSLSQSRFSADMVSKEVAAAIASSLRRLDKSELELLEKEWKTQILSESELSTKRALLLQKQIKLIRG